MKIAIRTLRRILTNELNEAARSLAEIEGKGLALAVINNKTYVLYDAKGLIAKVKKGNKDIDGDDIGKFCYAMIEISDKKDAWDSAQVVASAARKGFGPFMYDLVMSDHGALMADRSSVSGAAKNVWNVYKNKRSDVEAKPLDDKNNPKTPQKIDDTTKLYSDGDPEDPLNFAYVSSGGHGDVSSLRKRHDETLETLDRLGASLTDKNFKAAAFYFFDENYTWGS